MVPRTSTLSSVEKPLSVLNVLHAFSSAECADGAGGQVPKVWKGQELNC